MKKKILLILTIAVMILTSFAFAGCKLPKKVAGVDLDKETLMMLPGDEQALIADFVYQDGVSLRYTSSNESVVTVDEYGRLTAIKEGKATITVYYGKATDTCVVTVSMNGLVPLFQLNNVSMDTVSIYQSMDLDLSGTIVFNGKTYDDVSLKYEVSNKAVGSVVNGVFKPLKGGTTEVKIIPTWRGVSEASMAKTITVEVLPEMTFAVNDGVSEIILYTQQSDTVSTSSPFVVTAEYNGEPLQTTIQLTRGSEYVTYDEVAQTVQSKGLTGEAEITISYEVENEQIEKVITIHVKPTVYNYDTTVENFSAIHGDVATGRTLKEILAGDILSAYDENGNALQVKDNKVYGVQSSDNGMFATTITICSATHGYKMNIEGYTGVFAKAQDFAVFNLNARYGYAGATKQEGESKGFHAVDKDKPMQKFTGYYVLANNIDASNYEHATVGVELASRGIQNTYTYGFFGTFDGRGYTIKGMSLGAFGLFGYLVNATVKDVAFADVNLRTDTEQQASVLAAWVMSSTVSNVYISIANEGVQANRGSVFACGVNASTISACIVETKADFGYSSASKFSGSFTYQNKERVDGDAVQTAFAEVFVISNEKLGYMKDSACYIQAENETLTLAEGEKALTFDGVRRYATLSDMQNDTEKTTTKFNDYWTIENGLPVWNSLDGYYPPIVEDDGNEDDGGDNGDNGGNEDEGGSGNEGGNDNEENDEVITTVKDFDKNWL